MATTMTTAFGLLTVIALVGGCSGVADEDTSVSENALTSDVTTTKACFTTHNLGTTIAVSATVYESGPRSPDKPVTLLIHGMASDRSYWDGGPGAAVGSSPSFARNLASKGYVAIAFDRPGHGESVYKPRVNVGAGFQLTPFANIDMTHEIVEQIKTGDYTQTDGDCPSGRKAPFASNTVILAGFSLGGGLVEGYGAKYDDVAALIPISWANQGMSVFLAKLFITNQTLPQLLGKDYIPYYKPDKDGVSDECVVNTFYEPTANPADVRRICANDKLQLSPAGELDVSLLLQPVIRTAVNEKKYARVPVLMSFGEYDPAFPGAHHGFGDVDQQAKEIALWKENCGCDFTSYIQPNASHIGILQPNMPELADTVDSWLKARGLGGKN